MSLVLAIHGNPGDPSDFQDLAARLDSSGVRLVAPALSWKPDGLEGIIARLDAVVRAHESEDLILVGYSWGAYVALQYVSAGSREPAAMILVNPFLVATNPLSPAVTTLAQTPVLGSALLKYAAPRLRTSFLRDTFSPAAPPADAASRWSWLNASGSWQAAIRRKRGQGENPLSPIERLPCPTIVLLGGADRVSRWEEQRAPLRDVLGEVDVVTIEAAGHSILWTHPEEVISRLPVEVLHGGTP